MLLGSWSKESTELGPKFRSCGSDLLQNSTTPPPPPGGHRVVFPTALEQVFTLQLSLPRHPLKPASPPDALLVTASRSPQPVSLFFPLLPHPVAQLVLNLPVQSEGFQAAPPFLCSHLCSGTHPPNSSPRQYPHHVQSTQTFTARTWTIHPSNSTIFHHCEPSVLGQQALTQCKTLSSIT